MKNYFSLTKSGIVLFVVVSGLIGFVVGHPLLQSFEPSQTLFLVLGLYFLSSGSFAFNQAQEWKSDKKMKRTSSRPIPSGWISPAQAYILGSLYMLIGLALMYWLSPLTFQVGLLTVVLYNGFYTLLWKPYWNFGAVPGAIPGAMPVVIGYSVNHVDVFTPECVYLFLIMFLWQMPHFWTLAIHFKNDYKDGNFPVLPVSIGQERTLLHIGLYTFAYTGTALVAPLFVKTNILYILVIVPISIKVMIEFFKYFKSQEKWLPFFLWVNLSLLAFIAVPVFDKWFFYLALQN